MKGIPRARRSHRLRVIVETALAVIALTLIAGAIAANQRWLDAHFLPSFLLPRATFVRLETAVRLIMIATGLLLALIVRPRVGRFVARAPVLARRIALAAILALAASEPVLRRTRAQPVGWLSPEGEPLRRADARLGWTFVPARVGHVNIGGRAIDYAIDTSGYRVRRLDEPVDPARPAILFTGESVMFGAGLMWDESVPAQVGAILGVQSANLAVLGFGTDQAYLRLEAELPRFGCPVAIVALFMPALFGRNLYSERPHLGPGLVWLPPVKRWRLESLARRVIFYHSEAVIDRGIAVTREVLRATVDLARARGATPLILVPQFGREDPVEARLRQRILDADRLPYVFVELDPAWRLPWDRHPDARAAHAMAVAVADRLRVR